MISHIGSLTLAHPEYAGLGPALESATDLLVACALADGLILACGNGGSAADSGHFVGELMKGFILPRPLDAIEIADYAAAWPEGGSALAKRMQRAVRAISLVDQGALVSAIGNDLGYDLVYAQQVQGYGRKGDVLVAFSTSGNSANVVAAARAAKARGMGVIGFSGGSGGQIASLCDVAILVHAEATADIQLGHLAAYHALCAELEERLFGAASRPTAAARESPPAATVWEAAPVVAPRESAPAGTARESSPAVNAGKGKR